MRVRQSLARWLNFANRRQDVLPVSFNYRLGIFGFIDFSVVAGGEAYSDILKVAMLNQLAVMRWVKDSD